MWAFATGDYSIEGGKDVEHGGLGVSLSHHPVVEEESVEEWDEGNVDAEEVVSPHVEHPSEDPGAAEDSLYLLFKSLTSLCTYHIDIVLF